MLIFLLLEYLIYSQIWLNYSCGLLSPVLMYLEICEVGGLVTIAKFGYMLERKVEKSLGILLHVSNMLDPII